MHQILLITALTATTGLLGGGRHGGRGHCGHPTVGCYTPMYSHTMAYAPSCAPCGGYAAPTQGYAAPSPQAAPAAQAPAAPAKQVPAAPAKQAPVAPPTPQASAPTAPPIQAAYYPSFYHPAAPGCANGNCARR